VDRQFHPQISSQPDADPLGNGGLSQNEKRPQFQRQRWSNSNPLGSKQARTQFNPEQSPADFRRFHSNPHPGLFSISKQATTYFKTGH
jgi:hypothetical protein